MKKWNCDGCRIEIQVNDDYEPKICCNGKDCGCMGLPINPVFCNSCEEKVCGNKLNQ